MEIIIVLIPIGVLLLGIAVALFLWAVQHEQFDNLDVEGERILFDPDARSESHPPGKTPSLQTTQRGGQESHDG